MKTYYLAFGVLAFLGGCSGIFRDNPVETIREIEYYDRTTGKPYQTGKLVDDRPVEVEYRLPGTDKLIKKMQRRTGWGLVPPVLPNQKAKDAVLDKPAEIVPVK